MDLHLNMLNYRFDVVHTIAAESLGDDEYDAIIRICNTHLIPLNRTCVDLPSLTRYLVRQGYEFKRLEE